MIPHRINVKFFVDNPKRVNLPDFIPVFHRWIREEAVEGLPIDVADYKHVHEGPGIILVGHEADYALDMGQGRPGLLYSRKREWDANSFRARLWLALCLAVRGCVLMEEAPDLPVTFATNELVLTFPDQLNTPNTSETFAVLREAITSVLTVLYGGAEVELTQVAADSKRPFAVHVSVPDAPTLTVLQQQSEQVLAPA